MIHTLKEMKPIKQALFALLIGVSVILFWRGAWGIMDVYIFPNNLVLSYSISIIVGLGILAVTHNWARELK